MWSQNHQVQDGEVYENYDLQERYEGYEGELYEGENYCEFYDNDFRENDTQPPPQVANPTTVTTAVQRQPRKVLINTKWKAATAILAVLLTAAIAVLIYLAIRPPAFSSSQDDNSDPSNGSIIYDSTTGSCLDLKAHNVTASGIKTLRRSSDNQSTEIYCDMETDGGGWTLVASIHESDIKAKCTVDDRWSSYAPPGSSLTERTNWENETVFGSVQKCLVDDYKSPAYYDLNASDVMVWHVRWAPQVDFMKLATTLRYRSTNQFLQQYGGNLKSLFSEYLQLSPTASFPQNWQRLVALLQVLPDIRIRTTGWYNYNFTVGDYYLSDGNLYNDFGNRISLLSTRQNISNIRYSTNYNMTCASEISSSTTVGQPFGLLVMVKNEDSLTEYYSLDVYSKRTSEPSNITEFSSTRNMGNFELNYKAIQFYHPTKKLKTECRFHFYVTNNQEWKSKSPSKFWRNFQNYTSDVRQTTYVIEGNPSRILFGYILLSKESGLSYSTNETDTVADLILQKIPTDMFTDELTTLVVPVTFDQGSADLVLDTIPPDVRSIVQAGNLQFRAFNSFGYPNALCPGVRVSGDSPEYVCVGGVSRNNSGYGTCGDYAGWDGMPNDKRSDVRSVGHAHSSQDILSTLLIFYR